MKREEEDKEEVRKCNVTAGEGRGEGGRSSVVLV